MAQRVDTCSWADAQTGCDRHDRGSRRMRAASLFAVRANCRRACRGTAWLDVVCSCAVCMVIVIAGQDCPLSLWSALHRELQGSARNREGLEQILPAIKLHAL